MSLLVTKCPECEFVMQRGFCGRCGRELNAHELAREKERLDTAVFQRRRESINRSVAAQEWGGRDYP